MFNFFAKDGSRQGNLYYITDADCNHIKNVLRMKAGDTLLVSDGGVSHLCKVQSLSADTVTVEITEENYQSTTLPVKLYLFQGLPKSDKMELVIQKAVELGAAGIIPVEMKRSVVKLDDKKKQSKVARWQLIAESAAKQSKCSYIPTVFPVTSYADAVKQAAEMDMILVPYECAEGMKATAEALNAIKAGMSVGIFIGTEGGFEPAEIDRVKAAGGKIISLGQRILRTETAAIASVAMCMLHIEMNICEDNNG